MKRKFVSKLLGTAALLLPLMAAAEVIGPDLVGSITAPPRASSFQAVDFPITIRNVGNDEAQPFDYRVWMIPDLPTNGSIYLDDELLYEGRVKDGLAAGGTFSFRVGADRSEPPVTIPNSIRGERYTFRLEIDPEREVAEADVSNNVANSANKMIHDMPNLELSVPITPVMPWGCFFGQPIDATFQVCNRGNAPAWNFHPGLMLGDQASPGMNDATAATYPGKCYAPQDEDGINDPNQIACEPIGGREVPCVNGFCRLPCEDNADCGGAPGLVCRVDETIGMKSCMLYLEAPATPSQRKCITVHAKGQIPLAPEGKPDQVHQEKRDWRFHFVHDVDNTISQPLPFIWSGEKMLCRESLPDLVPTSMVAPLRLRAGEATPVKRVIKNLGFTEFPRTALPGSPLPPPPETIDVRYRYYLATTKDLSVNQIPVAVQSTGGAGVITALGTIKGGGENAITDLIVVPPQTVPGLYYLGLIVDPENRYRELDKANNVYVSSTRIRVEEPSLRILTDQLPTAVLGGSLVYGFVGVGGTAGYSWSAEALPPGLSLSSQGVLSGAPIDAGVFVFTVKLRSAMATTERMVTLQVVMPQSSLEITTKVLPLAMPQVPYGGWTDELGKHHDGIQLTASGGQPPYEWHFEESSTNRMPQGIAPPDSTGLIVGLPTIGVDAREFTVSVSDSLGNRTSARLRIEVMASGSSLTITSRRFAEGTAAQQDPLYDSCIEASGGDTSADYIWEVDASTIPPGLEGETQGKRFCLKGSPLVCGNYMVKVSVRDVRGQSFSTSVLLSVLCDSTTQINTQGLDDVRRGDVVEIQLGSNAGPDAIYRLYQGALPDGLTLSSGGLIAGTVAKDAAFGTYGFIVEVSDSQGRQGLTALAITVLTEARQAEVVGKTTGCGSTAAGSSQGFAPAGLAVLGLALLGRRWRGRRAADF